MQNKDENMDDDFLDDDFFEDEKEESALSGKNKKKKVLIVDDEEEVHNVTELALSGFLYEGYDLEILNAYSAKEAKAIFQQHDDICVAILDVVMETEHAGLDLAKWIRDDHNNKIIRIVLRTGQPGQAPEKNVIQQYDINDYKAKTELTSQKLYTLMYTALRSHEHIQILNRSKVGMENVIKATKNIIGKVGMTEFLQCTLEQILLLIGVEDSVVLMLDPKLDGKVKKDLLTGFSTGKFVNHNINHLDDCDFSELAASAINDNNNHFSKDEVVIFCANKYHPTLFYVKPMSSLYDLDLHLLKMFSENISIVLDNMTLNEQIIDGQKEMVYRLGSVVENRSRETGNHVKRVALYSQLLAELYGLPKEQCELIGLASPLHDIGKVSTPDAILHKPGSLNPEELEIMHNHAQCGYNMLHGSDLVLLETGAKIAGFHHEKWDGSGYPNQLAGDDIAIEGRITALADIFDALSSKRCYKNAWPIPKVLEFIEDESGKTFDPALSQLFLDHSQDFLDIRDSLK